MGNPFIRSEAFQPAAQPEPSANGILARVPAQFIAQGMDQLPPAGPDLQDVPREVLLSDVPDLGKVTITYRLNSYKHGRSRRWHWRAVRADQVPRETMPADASGLGERGGESCG